MHEVIIHTDGGCHGNPGPGGWAAVLESGPHRLELCGGVPATTNNRMELQGAIEALKVLKPDCLVNFFTDSAYVKNGVTTWVKNWKRNGWKTKEKKPVKNADLWRELDALAAKHKIEWRWLKGHAGHAGNERCDELANVEIEKIKKTYTRHQLAEHLAQFSAADTPDLGENLPL